MTVPRRDCLFLNLIPRAHMFELQSPAPGTLNSRLTQIYGQQTEAHNAVTALSTSSGGTHPAGKFALPSSRSRLQLLDCGVGIPWNTCSLHCSSFWGLPFKILHIGLVKPKKGTTMETIGRFLGVDDNHHQEPKGTVLMQSLQAHVT